MIVKGYDKPNAVRFSRQWWTQAAKSLFWAAIVTVLIWIYADMEFIDTETMNVTIRLTAGDMNSLVLLDNPEAKNEYEEIDYKDVRVSFSVRGSRSSLARLSRRLGAPSAPIGYDASVGRAAGKHDISADEVLKDVLELNKLGLTLLSASPATIKDVQLDKVIQQQIPVSPDFEEAELNPKWQPQTATVIISEKRWQQIKEDTSEAQRMLLTEKQPLAGRKPGEKFVIENARIIPRLAGEPVRLKDPTVSFEVEISSRPGPEMATYEARVNVELLTPPAWAGDDTWQKFTFKPATDRTPWTNVPVKISGPAEDIEKLKARLSEVRAFLILTQHDMTDNETPWTREVVIDLPEGLRLKVVGEKPKVSFWVRSRKGI